MADYSFEGPKWTVPDVTWSFAAATYDANHPFSSPIGQPYQDIVRQAFAAWAPYSGLTFIEVGDSNSVDIRVGFSLLSGAGQIGNAFFSFSQGVFLPNVVVRLEDPAETPLVNLSGGYTYRSTSTTLLKVAEHEIGHALGLGHSTDLSAIMFPTISAGNSLDSSDILGIETLYAGLQGTSFAVLDTTTMQTVPTSTSQYSGPVSGIQGEYINITSDSLNISTNINDLFIHTGAGTDAIAVHGGTNVLDGGTGSNFLTGGTGTDTFFVDDRATSADIWSTVVGFHAGDSATIWGVTAQDFGLAWVDGQGATGFTGLTLHATAAGRPTASLTLTAYQQADLNSGRLSVLFGADPASGSTYMYIHGNS